MANNGKSGKRPKAKARPRRNGNGNGNAMRPTSTRTYIANNSGNSRPVQNNLTKLSGSDFLTRITVRPAPTVNERILKVMPISPSAFPGTRLTQMSQLWEFFKFTKFHVRYVPAVPTTLACQLVLYLDLDPTDDPTTITDPDALIRQAVAQTGSQQWNFHTRRVIPLAMRADRQFYFTGIDKQNVRFSQQGVAYLIQVTDPVNFNGEAITAPLEAGSLFIDWTVQFNTPQINPSAAITAGTLLSRPTVTVDLTATGKEELYRVVGLTPRRYYMLTHTLGVPTDATLSEILCEYKEEVYAAYLPTGNQVVVNRNFVPGYLLLQADDEGIIDDLSVVVNIGDLSSIEDHRLILTTLFDEPVTAGSSSSVQVVRRSAQSTRAQRHVALDWQACEQCKDWAHIDSSKCTGPSGVEHTT